MINRDRIFYAACAFFAVGLLLAAMDKNLALFFFAGAYLLRPVLHAFDLAPKLADERQVQIHSRAGNIAFIAVMLAAVGFALSRLSKGEEPEELYAIMTIGITARAVTGLLMWGELRKAASIIITVVGSVVAIFVFVSEGFSPPSLFFAGLALVFASLGLTARKFPRTIGTILAAAAAAIVLFLRLYQFKNLAMWIVVLCLFVAAGCLFKDGRKDEESSPRSSKAVRRTILGLSAIVLVAFFIYLSADEDKKSSRSSGQPAMDTVIIQGVPCQGHVEYYSNGKLKTCTLAREDTLSGQPLPEGTVVTFNPEGVLDWCFLQKDEEIQGHLCKGQGHGWMTCFHPNGKLRIAWLGRDEEIQGVPVAEYNWWADAFGKGAGTYFWENGRLRRCRLSRDFKIEERAFQKGDILTFDENGKLSAEKK